MINIMQYFFFISKVPIIWIGAIGNITNDWLRASNELQSLVYSDPLPYTKTYADACIRMDIHGIWILTVCETSKAMSLCQNTGSIALVSIISQLLLSNYSLSVTTLPKYKVTYYNKKSR